MFNWHSLHGWALKAEARLIPTFIKRRSNPLKYILDDFASRAARDMPAAAVLLDAGAGELPYKRHFPHCRYECTDFPDAFFPEKKSKYTFLCTLDNIPKPAGYYDAVLCTQVLEHVPAPGKVIAEFARILKRGGKLYLTAPQQEPWHMSPYNFFNFTPDGLRLMFERAGFTVIHIIPQGGAFVLLAFVVRSLPRLLLRQHNHGARRPFVLVAYFVSLPFFGLLFPFLLSSLDFLDRKSGHTIGNGIVAERK